MPGPVRISSRWSGSAARSSSTTGTTASRPLSMIERPPITTTLSHGSSGITGRSRGRTSSRSSKVWRINGEGTSLAAKEDSDCETVFVMTFSKVADGATAVRLPAQPAAQQLSGGRDDRADVLAGQRAPEQARSQPVDDLDRPHVPGTAHQFQHRALDNEIRQVSGAQLFDSDLREQLGTRS